MKPFPLQPIDPGQASIQALGEAINPPPPPSRTINPHPPPSQSIQALTHFSVHWECLLCRVEKRKINSRSLKRVENCLQGPLLVRRSWVIGEEPWCHHHDGLVSPTPGLGLSPPPLCLNCPIVTTTTAQCHHTVLAQP